MLKYSSNNERRWTMHDEDELLEQQNTLEIPEKRDYEEELLCFLNANLSLKNLREKWSFLHRGFTPRWK